MWLYVPSAYLPVAAGSTWDLSAPELLAQSVAWNTKHMPPQSWRRVLRTAGWMRHLSGLMCPPSTAARGVESWISSLGDSLVRTSATPGSASASKASAAGSGRSTPESFAKWDHDTSSWRTSQLSLFADSTLCSPTFTRSGSMRSGKLFERPTLERPTEGSECLSWPTPDAMVANDGQDVESYQARRRRLQEKHRNGNGAGLVLAMAAKMWPTPNVVEDRGSPEVWQARRERLKAANPALGDLHLGLSIAAKMWPTASASDGKGSAQIGQRKGQLSEAAEQKFPSLQARRTPAAGVDTSTPSLVLNPQFVEALMGWPIGHSDCGSLATESSPIRQSSRGASCGNG